MPALELPLIIQIGSMLVTIAFFMAMLKHKTDQCTKEIARVEKDLCEHSAKVNSEISSHKKEIGKVNVSQASIEADIASIKTSLIRIESKLDRNY